MPSTSHAARERSRRVSLCVSLALLVVLVPAATVAGAPDGAAPVSDAAAGTTCLQQTGTATPTSGGNRTPAPVAGRNATDGWTPNESQDLDVALGDVAVIPLSPRPGENATVTVAPSDDGDGYAATVRVRDDGDGRVRLLLNTYLAANGSTAARGTVRAAGDDEVAVTDRTGGPLTPGDYAVRLRRNGTVVSENRLSVSDPSVENVTLRRAGPSVFDASRPGDVRRANRSGLLRPLRDGEDGQELVRGETLVARIDAPSLLGLVAAQPGDAPTERLLALSEERDPETRVDFDVTEICNWTIVEAIAVHDSIRAVPDYRTGAVYVLLDTSDPAVADHGWVDLRVPTESTIHPSPSDGDLEFDPSFTLAEQQTTVETHETGALEVGADGRANVSGETNLMRGSRLPVTVQSRTDPSERWRATATIREDGTFDATVDVSNASSPGVFEVRAGDASASAWLGSAPRVHWQLDHTPTDHDADRLDVEALSLPDGGYLVAYEYDRSLGGFRPIGTVRPYSEDLSIESIERPRYLLVVPHRDGNGNYQFDDRRADPPYRAGDRVVQGWYPVAFERRDLPAGPPSATFDANASDERLLGRQVPTPEPTERDRFVTPLPDATPTSASTAETSATPTETSVPQTTVITEPTPTSPTTADGPGFGALAALVGLLCGAAIAAMRR
ncbi:BGTF surface domain-containing protein [Halomicrobium salinisoli]|uniref:BGTF surface domain-containing protein n=1 Tax=Halomicrobium salinisoli TaxID=2878391 RepID=UPI001CEFBA35|nr:BGTF surface domain-containing protein [Halomicrobium salinisoli]